ncbi:hypothetical protein ABH926_003790 [Catenulispora sp. GP43]|uniref:hypothetical protein n=1 Tax=Catenulispora sp. GP43 TaxID=3156263 RepID=UPI0035173FAA
MSGEFEFHITVGAGDAAGLAAWAGERGAKFTHIVLARGETVSQPMLTVRADGAMEAVLGEAEGMAGELCAAGFEVTRVKVESSPYGDGVPATAAEALEQPEDRYFEHHLKLLLAPGVDEAALAELVTPHGAHLSRNARRVREDGRAERFVTQRCYRVGADAAVGELERLVAAVRGAGYEMVGFEREYVVYDSRPSVDAGWIG